MKKIIYLLALTLMLASCSSDDSKAPEDQTVTCGAPTSLDTNQTITETSATVKWGGVTGDYFQVEYGLNGFTKGSGITVNSNTNSKFIDGLDSDTAYDFYVRKNCGGDVFSDWAGPHSFVTN